MQKMRKKIMTGLVSSLVLVAMIGAVLFIVVKNDKPQNINRFSKVMASSTTNKDQVVKLVCSSADYKEKCEEPLKKAMEVDPKLTQPKELLKAYVKFAEDEVSKAFNKTISIKFETEREKGAFEDCKKFFEDAKDNIANSISELDKAEINITDLKSWLGAVISFQEDCVDGFPQGNTKTQLQNLFNDSEHFFSNSLAILSQLSSPLSTIQLP